MSEQTNPTAIKGPAGASSLTSALAAVFALLLSTAVLLMGNGLQGTLIPVRGNIENFQNFQLGLLGTGYFLGFISGCIFGPLLLRRGGHIRTFMAMASVASAIPLLHAIVLEPLAWPFFRAVTGFCFAILYIAIESWLNEKTSNEHRGAVFSVYTILNLTVITAGQMLIAVGDPALFGLFALASILVSLATLPVAFTSASAPTPSAFVMPNLVELYRNSPVGVAGCAAVGLANGAFWTLGPVFAQEHGFDVVGIGLFMSIVAIGGAVAQWPLGIASDRMDRRFVIMLSALIAGIATICVTFLAESVSMILILGGCFGAGAFPLYSLAVAHANDHAQTGDMVKISSGLLLVYGVGAAIGPLMSSLLEDVLPGKALFVFMGGVYAIFIAFVVWRIAQRAPASEEDRISFNESVISAQTVTQLEAEVIAPDATDTEPAPEKTL